MRLLVAAAVLLAPASLFGWGCDGHRIVALVARAHLTPRVSRAVDRLLRESPVQTAPNRYCADTPKDPMAAVASWADDVRRRQNNGAWHYIDIPRTAKRQKGIAEWCPPLAPAAGRKTAAGCVAGAIEYFAKVLGDQSQSAADRAAALRYLIHFTGDIHQPLHAIDDSDQGGNCIPVRFETRKGTANLHSVWDSLLLQREMRAGRFRGAEAFAAALDSRFASLFRSLARERVNDPGAWAWQSNAVARRVAYGDLEPAVPSVSPRSHVTCAGRRKSVATLHLIVGERYFAKAGPVIDKQLARAGFRLARLLNSIL
jgi:hypothetical protein